MGQFDGQTVIPLAYASHKHREWLIEVDGTRYWIMNEDGLFMLIRARVNVDGAVVDWIDEAESVDAFLLRHNLMLGTECHA